MLALHSASPKHVQLAGKQQQQQAAQSSSRTATGCPVRCAASQQDGGGLPAKLAPGLVSIGVGGWGAASWRVFRPHGLHG